MPVEREASASEDLLEDSTNRIEEFLRAQGYRDAAAPHTRREMDGELLITFNVTRGPVFRVARVDITGNTALPASTFESGLRLREGMPYSAAGLDADIAAIENAYRRSGFVGVKADSAVEPQAAPSGAPIPVIVRIIVREGVQTLVGVVTLRRQPGGGRGGAARAGRPEVGRRRSCPRSWPPIATPSCCGISNLGFENATVDVKPDVTRDGTRTDLLFTVREGAQVRVDHVIIVGNARTRTETIERELQLRAGDPLGREAMFESQRRLSALGLFRRVNVTAVGHGDERRRDLLVSVEEAAMTTIAYGGGLEGRRKVVQEPDGVAGERFQLAPRASVELARRNLFGGNRSATFFASGSLPLNTGEPISPDDQTSVPEYRVAGTYREPRAFDLKADLFLDVTFEQQIRSSFDFRRRAASAVLARRVTPAVVRQRQLSDSADRGVQQQRQPRGPAVDRPRLSASALVVVPGVDRARHAERSGRRHLGQPVQRGRPARGAGHRFGNRVREIAVHGADVPHPARKPPHRVRGQRPPGARHGVSPGARGRRTATWSPTRTATP